MQAINNGLNRFHFRSSGSILQKFNPDEIARRLHASSNLTHTSRCL